MVSDGVMNDETAPTETAAETTGTTEAAAKNENKDKENTAQPEAEAAPASTEAEDEDAGHTSCSDSDPEQEELEVEIEVVPAAADEASLDQLLGQLEDYTPTVPDAVTQRILNTAGFGAVDPRIVRIISVSAQKFISDIANDALQHCKTRTTNIQHSSGHGANKDKKNPKDRKYTLTMDDLMPALADHGITMRKPQYFV